MRIIINRYGYIEDDYYETELVSREIVKIVEDHLSQMDSADDIMLANYFICEAIRRQSAKMIAKKQHEMTLEMTSKGN